MLRHLRVIAVCACIAASAGCDGEKFADVTAPTPPPRPPSTPVTSVTVEFGGRVINADAGGPVDGVRVSLDVLAEPGRLSTGYTDATTSGADGAFTFPLDLPSNWTAVSFKLTAPGYDDTNHPRFARKAGPCGISLCWGAADRPAFKMYPTLVIRPGESIQVRVDSDMVWCGWDAVPCRRVLVAASPGAPVELEVVPDDSSKPMALGVARIPEDSFILEPDMSVRRLIVPPGGVPYVLTDSWAPVTGWLTAHR